MREYIGHVVESFSTHWGWRAGGRFWCCEIRFGLECFGSNQALDTKKTTRSSDSERTYCYDEGRFVQVLLFSPTVRFRRARYQILKTSRRKKCFDRWFVF